MISNIRQSSPKLHIVFIPFQHIFGANEDECIWWHHWHNCNLQLEGGKNLSFADDTDFIAGSKEKHWLTNTCMGISIETSKDTVTMTKGKHTPPDIRVDEKKLHDRDEQLSIYWPHPEWEDYIRCRDQEKTRHCERTSGKDEHIVKRYNYFLRVKVNLLESLITALTQVRLWNVDLWWPDREDNNNDI